MPTCSSTSRTLATSMETEPSSRRVRWTARVLVAGSPVLVALALGLLTRSCGRTPDGQTRRPNVLWIVTDQHRADIAGYEGNAVAATPSLDRLATESVRVSDFYCQVPLCVPARQSLLTGLDDIGLTTQRLSEIAAFQTSDRRRRPWVHQITDREKT